MTGAWLYLALASAHADPPAAGGPAGPIALAWQAPGACPDQDAVQRDVVAMVGETADAAVAFDATVTQEPETFQLELVTRWLDGREDRRTIQAPSCLELTDAAVLLIAITLDPVASGGQVREGGWRRQSTREREEIRDVASPEDQPDAVGPAGGPSVIAPPLPPPRSARPVTFGIRPEFALDWGSLPGVAPGGSINLSVTWKLLRAELIGGYWAPKRATQSDIQKQGAWIAIGSAGPRLCVSPTANTVSFPVCVGVEFGARRSRGIGTQLATPEYEFWSAATGGPTLIWAFIPRVAAAIGLDIVVPITRGAVLTATREQLHAPESVVLRPHLGLEVRL